MLRRLQWLFKKAICICKKRVTISVNTMEHTLTKQLTLVANPGSASRKYALYAGSHERAQLHFEYAEGRVVCTLTQHSEQHFLHTGLQDLADSTHEAVTLFRDNGLLGEDEYIGRIGVCIVAPSAYFLQDRVITGEVIGRLRKLLPRAPMHIGATLEELEKLRTAFKKAVIVGVSDSAFHITKPDYAWNYGISLEDADRYEIKRFGYQGLSVAGAIYSLKQAEKLPPKVIVCHMGSGTSVTAVQGGNSADTTMGYSPLEGTVMGTRSGSIDPTAVKAMKDVFRLNDKGIEAYLNNHSGLLGLGGSSDIRELLRREVDGDHRASLALQTYVYSVQKAIGQMAAVLNGIDLLVFTGTVGERSALIRERVLERLHYLDVLVDKHENKACGAPTELTCISRLAHSKPVYVVPTNEAGEIVRKVTACLRTS
jgi:acetate kinase